MANAQVKLYDSSNVELASDFVISGLEAGTSSVPVEVRAINAKDASAGVDFRNGRLIVRAKYTGDVDFEAIGIEPVDNRWAEVKITGA